MSNEYALPFIECVGGMPDRIGRDGGGNRGDQSFPVSQLLL